MTPRSLRTNNPGAINYGPFAQSHGATGTDGRLAIFPDVGTGYAAMEALLGNYETRHGLNTVSGIINRWAPRNADNNATDAYIDFVTKRLGVDPNATLTPDMRPKLAEAMAAFEAGQPVPRDRASAPVQTAAAGMGEYSRTSATEAPRNDLAALIAPSETARGVLPTQKSLGATHLATPVLRDFSGDAMQVMLNYLQPMRRA